MLSIGSLSGLSAQGSCWGPVMWAPRPDGDGISRRQEEAGTNQPSPLMSEGWCSWTRGDAGTEPHPCPRRVSSGVFSAGTQWAGEGAAGLLGASWALNAESASSASPRCGGCSTDVLEGEKEGMTEGAVWLPEHSSGAAPPPRAAWQEPLSPAKPGSGPASAGWGVSDHTQPIGRIGVRRQG